MGGVSPIHPTHASPPRRPALRLVRAPGAGGGERADGARARPVVRENQRSAAIGVTDARRIMAMRAAEALEGGQAAILRPERRRRLLDLAARLGLRPFDASLIIAIVQDGARRGEGPAHDETTGRLHLVRGAPDRPSPALSILAAFAIAVGVAGMIVAWLTGAM